MAESVSYWVCKCGTSNFSDEKRCRACGKRRPRRWLLIAIPAVLGLIAIGSLAPKESPPSLPEPQQTFSAQLEAAKARADAAANALARTEILRSRDKSLAELRHVEGWSGTVLGVNEMDGGAGVRIDFGPGVAVAGVYLGLGLDTLVPKQSGAIYQSLLNLRRGDEVIFSGEFLENNGALVEMSYTESGSANEPEFLFTFSSISKADPAQ